VGYVGKDVESIIHELVEVSANKIYREKLKEVGERAEKLATRRILNYLCQQLRRREKLAAKQTFGGTPKAVRRMSQEGIPAMRRQRVAELLRNNQLEEQFIEIEVGSDKEEETLLESLEFSFNELNPPFGEFYKSFKGYHRPQKRKVRVKEARRLLVKEEADKLLDFDGMVEEALKQAQEDAIVFIDEIDKLTGPKIDIGRDISGEGVQRDLLPIVEGTNAMTRYGAVKTDHILFIAAGTFSQNKPADLIPEFQGRFPLRVELNPLNQQDLERILVEPHNALTKQYQLLMATEGVKLIFTKEGVREIAHLAVSMNERMENIGARRLYTVMEKVLEELSFTAQERRGEEIVVDAEYVLRQAKGLLKHDNLSRYIL